MQSDPQYHKETREITEEAIERGYTNAHDAWRQEALNALYLTCTSQQEFTINDFRTVLNNLPHKTHDNRAVGGIIRTARKEGWIVPTGKTIESKVGHKSPLQIWRSTIYKPETTI